MSVRAIERGHATPGTMVPDITCAVVGACVYCPDSDSLYNPGNPDIRKVWKALEAQGASQEEILGATVAALSGVTEVYRAVYRSPESADA